MVSEITINFNLEKIFKNYIYPKLIDFSLEDFKEGFREFYYVDLESCYEIIQNYKYFDKEEQSKIYEKLDIYFKPIIKDMMKDHRDIYQIKCIYEKEGENFNIFYPIKLDNLSLCPPDYNLIPIPGIIKMVSDIIEDLFLNLKEEIEVLIEKNYDTTYSVEYNDFSLSIKQLRKYKHLCFILKEFGFNEILYHNNLFYIKGELNYQFNYYNGIMYPPEQIIGIFYYFEKEYILYDFFKNVKKYDFGFFDINEAVKLVIYKDIKKIDMGKGYY